MSLVCRPHREDYFPRLKRGHGTTHPEPRIVDGQKVRESTACVDPTCQKNAPKSKNMHMDTKANIQEWCDDHRLRVPMTAYEAMVKATGGR